MTATNVKLATPHELPLVLNSLKKNPGMHAWAIQDLQLWPQRAQFYYLPEGIDSGDLDYLLITGHPGAQDPKTIVMSGNPKSAEVLVGFFPDGSWLLRESPEVLAPLIHARFPEARIYAEKRMEVNRSTFMPAPISVPVRKLTESDASALAAFKGAPPQAAPGFLSWIKGAQLFAAWEGDKIAAIASTFVAVAEVWELIGIETKPEFRGKGFGSQVTSVLTRLGLENAPVVSLTVMKNNEKALKMYSKLGFESREDRIWVDNGTGSSPE